LSCPGQRGQRLLTCSIKVGVCSPVGDWRGRCGGTISSGTAGFIMTSARRSPSVYLDAGERTHSEDVSTMRINPVRPACGVSPAPAASTSSDRHERITDELFASSRELGDMSMARWCGVDVIRRKWQQIMNKGGCKTWDHEHKPDECEAAPDQLLPSVFPAAFTILVRGSPLTRCGVSLHGRRKPGCAHLNTSGGFAGRK
jgi:hypothetical protein